MPYDRRSLELTWGGAIGTAPGTTEIWQCGLHLAAATTTALPVPPEAISMQGLYETVIVPYHSSSDMKIASGALVKWVRLVPRDTAGKETQEALIYEAPTGTGGAVTASSLLFSPQSSVAITLWSSLTFLNANYGRYYLPWCGPNITTATGQIEQDVINGMANTSRVFLNGINEFAGGLDTELFVSNMTKVGVGNTRKVRVVRVGSVADTQRRRRNRLTENYTDVTLA